MKARSWYRLRAFSIIRGMSIADPHETTETLFVPFGPGQLRVCATADMVQRVEFTYRSGVSSAACCASPNASLRRAVEQLEEYRDGSRRAFDVPFTFSDRATSFQKAVWEQLLPIPYGALLTYGDIAKRLGTSPRAVGGALRANPLPILVPCHRIVAKESLGGFGGTRHLRFKTFLLELERAERQ